MTAAQQPAQKQDRQPGRESEMTPRPAYEPLFPGVGKLAEKPALITGGDSGIGCAVALATAREGADIAIVSFTRAMAQVLAEKKIRVNAVAPGPIWTPLIPATFERGHVEKHGGSVPLGCAGQPNEVAPCYVFLASRESDYITGQVLHPNGGTAVGS